MKPIILRLDFDQSRYKKLIAQPTINNYWQAHIVAEPDWPTFEARSQIPRKLPTAHLDPIWRPLQVWIDAFVDPT